MNTEDVATREDIEEAITHHAEAASSMKNKSIGNSQWTSPYDGIHARINELLDQWEEAY
jgi:hypothetical protein